MKKITFLLFIGLGMFLTSFKYFSHTKPSQEKEVINFILPQEKKNVLFILDPNKSIVSWKGYKIFKSDLSSHNGIAKIKEGTVTMNPSNSSLVSGKAIIDMTSFESLDLNNVKDMKAKLDGHLKSADFLDVEKFPTASFEVTGYKKIKTNHHNVKISGNLTLKDVTKNITFKANVTGNKNKIIFKSEEFDINRQDWGITYKGTGESLIKDEVTFKINLVAIPAK